MASNGEFVLRIDEMIAELQKAKASLGTVPSDLNQIADGLDDLDLVSLASDMRDEAEDRDTQDDDDQDDDVLDLTDGESGPMELGEGKW